VKLLEDLRVVVREGDLAMLVFVLVIYSTIWLATLPGGLITNGRQALTPLPPRMVPVEYTGPQTSEGVDWIDQMWIDDRREEVDGVSDNR